MAASHGTKGGSSTQRSRRCVASPLSPPFNLLTHPKQQLVPIQLELTRPPPLSAQRCDLYYRPTTLALIHASATVDTPIIAIRVTSALLQSLNSSLSIAVITLILVTAARP